MNRASAVDALPLASTAQEPGPLPPEPTDPPPRGSARWLQNPWLRQVFPSAVLSFLWAGLCNAVLNLFQTGGNLGRLFSYDLTDTAALFLLSTATLWVVLVLLIGLTGRLYLSCGVLLSSAVLLGFANYKKIEVRNEPLLPSDLSFVRNSGFLSDMVDTSTLTAVLSLALLSLVIAVLLGRISRELYPRITRRRSEPRLWRQWLVLRVVMVLFSVLILGYVSQFNQGGHLARAGYEKAGAQWAFWFQKVNYLRNGAVAGFLYNLPTAAMEEPPGYSRARMSEIADRYEGLAKTLNTQADPDLLRDLNVVVILSESFADPTRIEGVSLERDPIPFTRELMRSTVSGDLLTQHFGGGTANMEFEALTGQSLSQFSPQHDTPYSMTVYQHEDYPSVVGYLESLGHATTGIHPYMPTMYRRAEAYEALGFDRFVTEDDMDRSGPHRRLRLHLRRLRLRRGAQADEGDRGGGLPQRRHDAEPLPDRRPVRRPPAGLGCRP